MTILLENKWQATKGRGLIWLSLLACAGALYWGWDLLQTYGLSPGDGGALRPFGERLALGLFIASLGLLFAGGMAVYATLYVVHMARDGERLIVETLTPWGVGTLRREFDTSQVCGSAYYHGRMRTPRHSINAPWITLRISGRRFPFILDMQAETFRRGAVEALVSRAARARKKAEKRPSSA